MRPYICVVLFRLDELGKEWRFPKSGSNIHAAPRRNSENSSSSGKGAPAPRAEVPLAEAPHDASSTFNAHNHGHWEKDENCTRKWVTIDSPSAATSAAPGKGEIQVGFVRAHTHTHTHTKRICAGIIIILIYNVCVCLCVCVSVQYESSKRAGGRKKSRGACTIFVTCNCIRTVSRSRRQIIHFSETGRGAWRIRRVLSYQAMG